MIEFFYEDTEILDLDPEFFVLWLGQVCDLHNKTLGEVTVVICSDDYLLEMNREHLNHDYYTDIITFNYNEGALINGDLFISIDRVYENADYFGVAKNNELYRVIVHGILHLIGFNDKTKVEEEEMRRQESRSLDLIVSRET